MSTQESSLIAHVIHRLNVGGLENGLVNLINNLPDDKYQHAVICLTESTEFVRRIQRADVEIYELHKRDGKDLAIYLRLWKLLRKIKPDIVHTRNLSALEVSVIAALAGVPIRIHGEHGRDIYDLHGKHKRYQQLRRFCARFIHYFIALSQDLEDWLANDVGISREKIVQIYNGVDVERFYPAGEQKSERLSMPAGFADASSIVIGTVGRLEPVKDQLTLVRAFIELWRTKAEWQAQLRLVLVGDGSLRLRIEAMLDKAGIKEQVWLAGSRDNVPDILRELDIFVLPSLGEGISNTILEAMASGLPVVATCVGGNPELVQDGVTGTLVQPNDFEAMAETLCTYLKDTVYAHQQGLAGRQRVVQLFSLTSMMRCYELVYDALLMARKLEK